MRRADLAMLHGRTVYEYFKDIARNSGSVEDIHLEEADRISQPALVDTLTKVQQGPLRFGYVGQTDEMKGWQLWFEMLAHLKSAGVAFKSLWLGDGHALGAMKAQAAKMGLSETERAMPCFVADRPQVLEVFRSAQFLLFC